jgi:hypothetical protein
MRGAKKGGSDDDAVALVGGVSGGKRPATESGAAASRVANPGGPPGVRAGAVCSTEGSSPHSLALVSKLKK